MVLWLTCDVTLGCHAFARPNDDRNHAHVGSLDVLAIIVQCKDVFQALEQKAVYEPMFVVFMYNLFQVRESSGGSAASERATGSLLYYSGGRIFPEPGPIVPSQWYRSIPMVLIVVGVEVEVELFGLGRRMFTRLHFDFSPAL